jgi:hypothetical protein
MVVDARILDHRDLNPTAKILNGPPRAIAAFEGEG